MCVREKKRRKEKRRIKWIKMTSHVQVESQSRHVTSVLDDSSHEHGDYHG